MTLIARSYSCAMTRWLLFCSLAIATATPAQTPRMVLIDQDGSGPGGSNQMALMVLLQSPQVKVLGITMVSGPQGEMQPVHVQDDLDSTKFDKMFVDLMKAQPVVP